MSNRNDEPNGPRNNPSPEETVSFDLSLDQSLGFSDRTMSPPEPPAPEFATQPYLPGPPFEMVDPTPSVVPLRPDDLSDMPSTLDTLAQGEMPPFPFADRIPGYRLLQMIGRGGLGSVYLATHRELGMEVAIKVLHYPYSRHSRDAEAQQVLHRLGRLRHPNLVGTYGTGTQGGYAYFVMEYIDGPSLQRFPIGEEEGNSITTAVSWLEQVARGAHYLHEQGIIHRDIKPGNILIDRRGRARLADYGLAMFWPLTATEFEGPAAIMGTPAFMAPEQALGLPKQFGPTLDVWALGSTLYWLLTGQPPFRRPNVMEILYALLNEEAPDPRTLQPNLPADLVAICRTCLRRETGQRYPTALAVAEDLQRFLRNERPLGIPGSSRRPWWAFWRRD